MGRNETEWRTIGRPARHRHVMLRHRDVAVVVILIGKRLVSRAGFVAVIENQRPTIPALRIAGTGAQPRLDHLKVVVVSVAMIEIRARA